MKTYTIIGGVNGVGKSSLSGVLSAENTDLGIIIDVDKITADVGGNKIIGGKIAMRRINDCIEKGVDFTQETTLAGVKTLKTVKKVRSYGFRVKLYYVGISSASESISRIKNRVAKGGHNISDEDVVRRYDSRFSDLAKILPYCNEVHFYDNENGFVEKAEYKNGEFVFKNGLTPKWLNEFVEFYCTDF